MADFRFLIAAQNKMLRRICGFKRLPEEQWQEWFHWGTRGEGAREKAQAMGVRCWQAARARAEEMVVGRMRLQVNCAHKSMARHVLEELCVDRARSTRAQAG